MSTLPYPLFYVSLIAWTIYTLLSSLQESLIAANKRRLPVRSCQIFVL